MGNPLVSVLVPFKNTENYLPECLDSILAQTFQLWEVIAVDDSSEDDSLKIVQAYTQNDSRIKVFKNVGKGIIPALRTAYGNSKGQFITRMDSDDVMAHQKLEQMTRVLKEKGPGHLSVGLVHYFSKRGISNGYQRYESWLNSLTKKGGNFKEIYKECVVPSPCWMVYRQDLDACGDFQPNRYPEDYDLTFRFYEKELKIIPCNEVLHHWRDYDERTSRTSEHYAQNYFLDIKIHYFLKLDYVSSRPLVVWGAGYKGKVIAKHLISKEIDFTWLCDNPNKIDKKIYGQSLHHFSMLKTISDPQSIITVANEDAQEEIKTYLKNLRQEPMRDFFFFC